MKPEPKKGEKNPHYGLYVQRPFHIVSRFGKKRYIDVLGRNLVIKTSNGRKSQIFFFDQRTKTIRNQAQKHYSINIGNRGRNANIELWNTNSEWYQIWQYHNGKGSFTNIKSKKVIEITGGKDTEGSNVGYNTWRNQGFQRWSVIYLDTHARQRIKGLNSDFGFFINRPFYIVSKMWMNRVLEVVGGRNLVIKTRANRAAQQFIFDEKSKTIQSKQYRGKSLDIQNAGRSANLQVWTTNSRWF